MESLKNYIYMDMVGIDSLLSQIISEQVEISIFRQQVEKPAMQMEALGFRKLSKKYLRQM